MRQLYLLTIVLISFNINAISKKEQIKIIFEKIDKYPFKYKDLIKKQILLETGHLSSKVYKRNHNLFGMKYAKKRKTTAISSKYGYAVYRNIDKSIKDRYLYEQKYLKHLSKQQYLRFLNKVYSKKNGKYTKILKRINIDKYK